MKKYDVVIIGAGAAGLMAAATAVSRGRKTVVIDMGPQPGRKVMAAGGGRCNFTNAAADHTRYFGENPNFVRGALARFSPTHMLNWAKEHGIQWTEKTPGQYFCANNAGDMHNALVRAARGADIYCNHAAADVLCKDGGFIVRAGNDFYANAVIIATGGTSYPTLGVSDFGMKIAKKLGHKIIPVRPALCAIKTDAFSSELAGISINAEITVGARRVRDAMLFTHFGIGGPAAYRATLSDLDNGITINLLPDMDVVQLLKNAKRTQGKKSVATVLAEHLPVRVAKYVAPQTGNIADIKDQELAAIGAKISAIKIDGANLKRHGLQSAEVVRGGVATNEISSKTMESKLCPGVYFAGEVLDVAGDLGGFNLQWAFASGVCAGNNA